MKSDRYNVFGNSDSHDTPSQDIARKPGGCIFALLTLPAFYLISWGIFLIWAWVVALFRFPHELNLLFVLPAAAACLFGTPLVSLVTGQMLEEARIRFFARRSDRAAQALTARIAEGKQECFILFLRPFDQDFKFIYSKANLPADYIQAYEQNEHYNNSHLRSNQVFDLMDHLSKTIGPAVQAERSIIIGNRSDYGIEKIGTVETDDANWQDVARSLFESARLIICLPGTTPGVQWELDQIFERYLSKTLFVSPPLYWFEFGTRIKRGRVVRDGCLMQLDPAHVTRTRSYLADVHLLFRNRYARRVPDKNYRGCLYWYEDKIMKSERLPNSVRDFYQLNAAMKRGQT